MRGLSAVVATYQRDAPLRKLFDSLLQNECDCLEVIVVDQNKNNLIDNLIQEYAGSLNIKHLKIDVPNQSTARNYGAKYATYPLICFPDDDCWFDSNSIGRVLNHFDQKATTDLLIINWRQGPFSQSKSMTLTKERIFSYRAPITYSTYIMFFKTTVFFDLGCFEESIGIGKYIGSGEDTELLFRAARAGCAIYYDADTFVNHKYTPHTDRDPLALRVRQRGSGFMYRKFKLSYYVILRGFVSPLFKMIVCMNWKKSKAHYNMFRGRLEGFIYAVKENNATQKQITFNKS